MIFSLETWLLPAIAAGSSSYLVSLGWERFRKPSAPTGMMAGFLAALSFIMGAICAYYRHTLLWAQPGKQHHHHVCGGGPTTYLCPAARKYFPGTRLPRSNVTR